ncbi:MAG: NAD(P)H-dependent oxidoreductase, partial [Myxococcales bacterium]|nr:NAD(P)H-dependent oxidoreductase [Myxococcales bacterium]
RAWREALRSSDAVFMAAPEYGHSLPGALKNAIDWLIGSGELYGKPVAITAAVGDPRRGHRGLDALARTLRAAGARVVHQLPTVASDEAAGIVAVWRSLRAEEAPLVLHDYAISGNGWKVRTVLRHLGRPFVIRWIDILKGEQHAPDFVAKNPASQIPVLELPDGRCLRESSAILLALADGTELLPDGPERHEALAWLSFEQTFVDGIVSRSIFRRLYPEVLPTPEAFFDAWRAEGTRGLEVLDRHLEGRSFVVGEALSIADIALYAYTHRAPLGGFDLEPLAALRAWHARIAKLPAVRPIEDNPEASR